MLGGSGHTLLKLDNTLLSQGGALLRVGGAVDIRTCGVVVAATASAARSTTTIIPVSIRLVSIGLNRIVAFLLAQQDVALNSGKE